jgi:hypothetical protein
VITFRRAKFQRSDRKGEFGISGIKGTVYTGTGVMEERPMTLRLILLWVDENHVASIMEIAPVDISFANQTAFDKAIAGIKFHQTKAQ